MKKLNVTKCFFITFLIFLVQDSFTQSITFQKVFGSEQREEIGLSVVQTIDNGYIAIGGGYRCLRTDQYGDSLWTGRVPSSGNCIKKTDDNNFILTSVQFPLVKFDLNGNVIWNRNSFYDNAITEYISETEDKGFILSGGVINGTSLYAYILKTDSLGHLEWQKTFNNYFYMPAIKIVQTTDHGYLFTGNDSSSYAIKIDSAGNIIWYKSYKTFLQYASSVLKIKNGFVICGLDKLLRIDENGNVLWYKSYSLGIDKPTYLNSIMQDIDGGFVMTGKRDTTLENSIPLVLLLKTDSAGNESWNRLFGQNIDYNEGKDVRQTSDSGYIISGVTYTKKSCLNSFTFNSGKLILIKTDKHGDLEPLSIIDNTNTVSPNFSLYQNYPNPFNPTTSISYTINQNCYVSLKVYDVLGKEISNLVNEFKYAGNYEVKFNGSNYFSGLYFYRLQIIPNIKISFNLVSTKKMLLIK